MILRNSVFDFWATGISDYVVDINSRKDFITCMVCNRCILRFLVGHNRKNTILTCIPRLFIYIVSKISIWALVKLYRILSQNSSTQMVWTAAVPSILSYNSKHCAILVLQHVLCSWKYTVTSIYWVYVSSGVLYMYTCINFGKVLAMYTCTHCFHVYAGIHAADGSLTYQYTSKYVCCYYWYLFRYIALCGYRE